jgi:hypothetical protein
MFEAVEHRQMNKKLSGVVQFDESMVFKDEARVNYDSDEEVPPCANQMWLFGACVENNIFNAVFEVMPNRKAETFNELLGKYMTAGSFCHHDSYPAYKGIKWDKLKLKHKAHRHKKDPKTGRVDFSHSNTIEGLWGLIKNKLGPFHGLQSMKTLKHFVLTAYV